MQCEKSRDNQSSRATDGSGGRTAGFSVKKHEYFTGDLRFEIRWIDFRHLERPRRSL